MNPTSHPITNSRECLANQFNNQNQQNHVNEKHKTVEIERGVEIEMQNIDKAVINLQYPDLSLNPNSTRSCFHVISNTDQVLHKNTKSKKSSPKRLVFLSMRENLRIGSLLSQILKPNKVLKWKLYTHWKKCQSKPTNRKFHGRNHRMVTTINALWSRPRYM